MIIVRLIWLSEHLIPLAMQCTAAPYWSHSNACGVVTVVIITLLRHLWNCNGRLRRAVPRATYVTCMHCNNCWQDFLCNAVFCCIWLLSYANAPGMRNPLTLLCLHFVQEVFPKLLLLRKPQQCYKYVFAVRNIAAADLEGLHQCFLKRKASQTHGCQKNKSFKVRAFNWPKPLNGEM